VDLFKLALVDLHLTVSSPWCEAICILVACACGAVVGFEREKGHKPAGLRTQILICLGSAILTVVSMSPTLGGHEPARIAAQIVTGVGFLGAGSILREHNQITGLTTAATIWTVSAIGIAAGAGYVTAALLLSFSVLLVLGVFRKVEAHMDGHCHYSELRVVYRPEQGKTRALILGALDDARGPHTVEEEAERPEGLAEMRVRYCEFHRDHRHFLADLAAIPGVAALDRQAPPAG
jgi:putative Mg2+ transporter-C (MgtC) family protein